MWKCIVRKNFNIVFQLFFPVTVSQSNPYYYSIVKKMFTVYFWNKFNKHIFASKLVKGIQTFKTKKCWKFLKFIFYTVYMVHGAVVSEITCQSESIQALLKMRYVFLLRGHKKLTFPKHFLSYVAVKTATWQQWTPPPSQLCDQLAAQLED